MVRAKRPLHEIAADLARDVILDNELICNIDRVFASIYAPESTRAGLEGLKQLGKGQMHVVYRVGELGGTSLALRIPYKVPKLVGTCTFESDLIEFENAYRQHENVPLPLTAVAWLGTFRQELFCLGGILFRDLTDSGRSTTCDDVVGVSKVPDYMYRKDVQSGEWEPWFIDPTGRYRFGDSTALADPEYRLDVVSELAVSEDPGYDSNYFRRT